jgi:Sulfatase
VRYKPKRALTRKDFLRAARAGVAGVSLIGVGGCRDSGNQQPQPPSEDLPSGGSGPKNVILVIIDSLRKDHVGAYGNDWIETPTLNSIARESLRFTRAHPEAMATIPARRAIHTGMRTWSTRPPHFTTIGIENTTSIIAPMTSAEGCCAMPTSKQYKTLTP